MGNVDPPWGDLNQAHRRTIPAKAGVQFCTRLRVIGERGGG